MSSLRITMHAREPIVLSANYRKALQGLLYDCWRKELPWLHDEGFRDGPNKYSLFVFSPLTGGMVSDDGARRRSFTGPITFEVRSPADDHMEILASELERRGAVRIGRHEAPLPLVNLELVSRRWFPRPVAHARTVQPIYVKSHGREVGPHGSDWLERLQSNAASKARAWRLDPAIPTELWIDSHSGAMHRWFFEDGHSEHWGWAGDFAIACDPRFMQFLYHCGLGAKSSDGLGMFDIVDEPA